MTLEAGIVIAQALIKYTPAIARSIATIFSKPEHNIQDWLAVFDAVEAYEKMDADSKARVGTTQP